MATNTGMFPDTIVTNAGKKMIVQSQNGSRLTITRVALGDGVLGNNEDQQELTAIKSEKLSADISQFEDLGNGQFTLTFTIDNSAIEKGFWHREIGIMAKVDDADEQLYAYTNAGSAASFLYDKSTPIQARTVKIDIVIGSAENVNVTIDKSVVYTTHKDLEEHNSDADAHAALVEKLNQGTAALLEQNNLYHVESTGYGIVSGCEPSINGLTVTVSAGVIHTADGRRVEVPEQSITLDAADATKPRTDVVYLDKYGKIAKLTGELGTPAVAGSNTYTISTNFAAGDTVTFGGVVFTCTSSTQDATNFVLGADTATSATNLATALNANSSINAIYTASTSGSVVTITEKSAGGGNTPGAMMTSGTGVVTAGLAVSSTTAFSTAPGLMEAVIKVGEIAIKAGAVAGAITASYNHYKTATITYHNVSMMRQDRTLMPGMVAHTLGYYAPNDGGGAVYIIRQKKENDVDDGGSVIFLDTNNVAELIIKGAVNVKQFGAKGDGNADDTTAIKNAINFAREKHVNMYINCGEFLITSALELTRNIHVLGAGIDKTILHMQSYLTISGNGIHLSDISIVSDYKDDYTIQATYLTGGTVLQNMRITAYKGIKISQSWYFSISNILLHVLDDGVGMNLHANNAGGVNAASFNKIFINGGANSLIFTKDEKYFNDNVSFIGSAFENCTSTAIVNRNNEAHALSFVSCYFENVGTNLVDVPLYEGMGADNPFYTTFLSCIVRTQNTKALSKGQVVISNLINYSHHNKLSENGKAILITPAGNFDTDTGNDDIAEVYFSTNKTREIKPTYISMNLSTEEVSFARVFFRRSSVIKIDVIVSNRYIYKFIMLAGNGKEIPVLLHAIYDENKIEEDNAANNYILLTSTHSQYDANADLNYVDLKIKADKTLDKIYALIKVEGIYLTRVSAPKKTIPLN